MTFNMKKQEANFAPQPKSESLVKKQGGEKTKSKETEILNDSQSVEEEFEEIDINFLQEVMKDEGRFTEMLIKMNDKAVQDIQAGSFKDSLALLERMEKILEYAAINKKILDRNLVIVCLYNIACNYQAMWMLDKCSKYIDGVVYNLDQSSKQDEELIKEFSFEKIDPSQRTSLRAIKLRKLQFLLKVYLQYCAVLSQLSKHEEALLFAKKSQKVMAVVINECLECCKEAQRRVDSPSTGHTTDTNKEEGFSLDVPFKSFTGVDSKRVLDNSSIFRDEVSYLKNILDYALPFINDLIQTTGTFSIHKTQELLKQARKSLFNWKNNPENNEKYLRKEFGKTKLPNELKDENRSLLGVQRPVEWLENLNIGTIMHMKPIKYRDYAQKKEFTNEITKDSLQEKVIYQSLVYFTIATEMRFIEMSEDPIINQVDAGLSNQESKALDKYRNSEGYHLKAIEIVCRYVNRPCPYINHLISSYQKHYNQNLEIIPEESYCSGSEGITTQEVSREYEPNHLTAKRYLGEHYQPKLNNLITGPVPQLNKSKLDWKKIAQEKSEALHEKNRKTVSDQFREERLNHIREEGLEKVILKKEIAERKAKKGIVKRLETEPAPRKSLNLKTKRKATEDDENKHIQPENLSHENLTLGNLITQHFVSPTASKIPATTKEQTTRYDQIEVSPSDSRYFMRKNYDIPTLNMKKVPLRQSGQKTQHTADKIVHDQEPGFMSERNIKKVENKHNEMKSSSPKKVSKSPNDPSINLFFYKNFNKFIQNLYIQDEQDPKKSKLEIKKGSKLTNNNPYSKEIAAISTTMRKTSQNKRQNPPAITKNRNEIQNNTKSSSSFVKGIQKEKDEPRKGADKSTQGNSKKDSEFSKDKNEDHDPHKLVSKLIKSVSFKTVPGLDLAKVKESQEKYKAKHLSPRD